MELEEIIISVGDMATYNELRSEGYICRWCGDGMICMVRPKNWQELINVQELITNKG